MLRNAFMSSKCAHGLRYLLAKGTTRGAAQCRQSFLVQNNHDCSRFMLLSRNQSTDVGNFGKTPELSSPVSRIPEASTSVLEPTKSVGTSTTQGGSEEILQSSTVNVTPTDPGATPASDGLVFVPAETLTETSGETLSNVVGNIPEPPAFPSDSTAILETVLELAANGEPTFKSLGLGGWYPSGIVQTCLEFFHCNLGLPWWAAIATGTIIVRVLLFPIVIKSRREMAKMTEYMPKMSELQQKVTSARMTGNQMMAQKYSFDMQLLMKENNVNPLRQMILPFTMTPVFMSFFFGLRSMANLPVESLKTGGILWFTDLTLTDPYYLLPMICSATVYVTMKTGADAPQLATHEMGHLMKYVIVGIPVIMFPFIMNFNTAVLCYWTSQNFVSLAQVQFLKIPAVREYFKIPERKKTDVVAKRNKGFKKDFKEAWSNMKLQSALQERDNYDSKMFERAGRVPIVKTYKYDPTKTSPAGVQAKSK